MNGTVLITGANSGLGKEFAKIFAKEGYNMVITGRNKKTLSDVKKQLKESYNIKVNSFPCNLSNMEEVKNFCSYIEEQKFSIDVLINNAGLGYCGYFGEVPWNKHEEVIRVNIIALTYLTRFIIEDMKKKRSGKILNIASTGAYQPGPLTNVYYASKAYVLSFSQALKEEVKDLGITVVALCPGTTKTDFAKRAGKKELEVAMSAEKVAYIGYKCLFRRRGLCIPGGINKAVIILSKLMPANITAKIVKKIQKKAISNRELDNTKFIN